MIESTEIEEDFFSFIFKRPEKFIFNNKKLKHFKWPDGWKITSSFYDDGFENSFFFEKKAETMSMKDVEHCKIVQVFYF
jgi:hypothetical protein